jgi:CO/xanthine dehydrogenase Mo-binding subunit
VSNAFGVRMTHVPMSPPRILKALEEAGKAA